MSGLSGARVLVIGDDAVKMGYDAPNRVVEQGQWLLDNAETHLPVVRRVLPRGYAMEALTHIPIQDVSLDRVVDALADSVWRYAPTVHVDTSRTLLKIDKILRKHAPQLLPEAITATAYIRRTDDCLAHGDPTAENVMLRGDTYVIIDPLPATEAIPDDAAVDVGKLLQSAHGWEEMKGEERSHWRPEDVAKYFSDEVFAVGELWCVVHFIRTLPYVSKEVKPRVVSKLAQLLGL